MIMMLVSLSCHGDHVYTYALSQLFAALLTVERYVQFVVLYVNR